MPRKRRQFQGEVVYHVMNRAAARATLFQKGADYAAFERILAEAQARIPVRMLTYVVMPNHFHLVLWPTRSQAAAVSDFMQWLQMTHVQRWHAHYGTAGTGHVYQGRFKAFPVQAGEFVYLRKVCRYVERNPLRAKLVERAEAWRWGGLWRRLYGSAEERGLLTPWPGDAYPGDRVWTERVNTAQREEEERAVRESMKRGRPFGAAGWVAGAAKGMGLEHTLRARGRPRKNGAE